MGSPTKEWKLCVVGDPGVGKTSLGIRFKHDSFNEKQMSTVGAAFFTVDVTIDGEVCRLNAWDTAGQERYRALAPLYYRNTQCVIMVYSINKYESYKSLEETWFQSVRSHSEGDTVLTVVGNKLDTAFEHRQVDPEEAQKFASDIDAEFFETSAKTGENVEQVFLSIARRLRILNQTRLARRNYSTASSTSTVSATAESDKSQQKSSGCCR